MAKKQDKENEQQSLVEETVPEETVPVETASGKETRGEMPEWKKEEYSGSLTCDQAEWRLNNLRMK